MDTPEPGVVSRALQRPLPAAPSRRIEAEFGTRMLLEFAGFGERIKCELVGMDPDRYLILKLPLTMGVRTRMFAGNTVTIRYMHKGRVVGFRSDIIDYLTKPFSLGFFSYPMSFETFDLRKEKRVDCYFPAQVNMQGREFKAIILDFSSSGCKLSLDAEHASEQNSARKNDRLEITFHILDSEVTYTAAARIRNATRQGDKVILGLKFENTSIKLRASIDAYIMEVEEALAR